MKKKTIVAFLAILLAVALIGACTPKETETVFEGAGEYFGTIPAADSPGINVQLILNPDFSFILVYDYIDAEEESVFTWEGVFIVNDDIITLEQEEYPPAFPALYKLGEDYLIQLDLEGNEIEGEFAEMYILRK